MKALQTSRALKSLSTFPNAPVSSRIAKTKLFINKLWQTLKEMLSLSLKASKMSTTVKCNPKAF